MATINTDTDTSLTKRVRVVRTLSRASELIGRTFRSSEPQQLISSKKNLFVLNFCAIESDVAHEDSVPITKKMNNSELISNEIYHELFDGYFEEQVDELNNSDIEELDSVYASLFKFYGSFSEENQSSMIPFIREIVADTASIILAGIDGVQSLGAQVVGSFELKYDGEVVSFKKFPIEPSRRRQRQWCYLKRCYLKPV